ncbi:hypothetical protein ACT3SZ_14420 [Corynebacterium sp. AOP40-9SA-29]|uniref:hypothetical protein n=1 Tax=Corynebacterium sp. AOP40-9SA-29 TaxID=3457677 RepID=UPI0040332BFD
MIAGAQVTKMPDWNRAELDMNAVFRMWEQSVRRLDIPSSDADGIVKVVRGGTFLGRFCQWFFSEDAAAYYAGVSVERCRDLVGIATRSGIVHLYPDRDMYGGTRIELDTGI